MIVNDYFDRPRHCHSCNCPVRSLDLPNVSEFKLQDALKFSHQGWWECEFDPPVKIRLDHLCMLHQEVMRLDRELFCATLPANTALDTNQQLSVRAETTYLNIIGGLLGLMLGKSPGGQVQSIFTSQAAIIAVLLGHHEGKPGMSQRTLEERFARANRSLSAS